MSVCLSVCLSVRAYVCVFPSRKHRESLPDLGRYWRVAQSAIFAPHLSPKKWHTCSEQQRQYVIVDYCCRLSIFYYCCSFLILIFQQTLVHHPCTNQFCLILLFKPVYPQYFIILLSKLKTFHNTFYSYMSIKDAILVFL